MTTGVETFFRSRWVDAPAGVTELEPTRLPAGFRAAGVAAGLKPSGRLDVGVLVCDADPTSSAALFTRNSVVAAPVKVTRRADLDALRAIAVNAGNANVGTGERGIAVAEAMRDTLAAGAGFAPARVGVASTGIIGVELERDPILDGIERAVAALAEDGGGDFSTAILTSDRGPKRACVEVVLPSGPVVVSAQAKGAGMLAPDFATMLCFVETDAGLGSAMLAPMLRKSVSRSFERVTVDGQLSTNDSVFAIASGSSGVRVEPASAEEQTLAAALDALLRQLAIEMVADGEGATRVARLAVRGPAGSVDPVASAVANSPLVKCALHGGDPNWGRVLQAAGQALADGTDEIDLAIEGVGVARRGEDVQLSDADRHRLDAAMRAPEVEMTLGLPGADAGARAEAEIFFCDLSPEYVRFNSEYST